MTSLIPVRYKDKTQLISQRCAVHSLHHFHLSLCSETSHGLPPILITLKNVKYLKNIKNISGIKVFYSGELLHARRSPLLRMGLACFVFVKTLAAWASRVAKAVTNDEWPNDEWRMIRMTNNMNNRMIRTTNDTREGHLFRGCGLPASYLSRP